MTIDDAKAQRMLDGFMKILEGEHSNPAEACSISAYIIFHAIGQLTDSDVKEELRKACHKVIDDAAEFE